MKLLYLGLVLVALVAAIYFSRKSRVLNNMLIFVFTTLLFVCLIEGAYRLFFSEPKLYNNLYETSEYLLPDSMLNYKMKAGTYPVFETYDKDDTIFQTTYHVINDSTPSPNIFNHRAAFRSDSTSQEVVFLGCSFTFGDGVPDTSTLPYLTGKKLNRSSVNLGVSGYGINQVYQNFVNRYGNGNHEDRVFVYSFLTDHLLRANGTYAWNNEGPFFRRIGDSLQYTGSTNVNDGPMSYNWVKVVSANGTFRLLEKLCTQFTLNRNLQKFSEEDSQRYLLMIRKMIETAQKRGGKFILLFYDKANWGQPSVQFLQREQIENDLQAFQQIGATVVPASSLVDLSDEQNFIRIDGHPSVKLYDTVSSRLAAIIDSMKSSN